MSSLPSLVLSLPLLGHVFTSVSADATPKVVRMDFQQVQRDEIENPTYHRFSKRASKPISAQIENAQNNLLYLMNCTVGTPPQPMALQLDTGSSDIWIPASDSDVCLDKRCTNGAFDPSGSSTFNDLAQNAFQIAYVDGTRIQGDYIGESFGVGGAEVKQTVMGLAQDSVMPDTISPFQGIVGIGYQAGQTLASANPDSIYPTLLMTMKNESMVSAQAFSLWLNDLESKTGSILFGGVDTEKYEGDLVALPVQKDAETNSFSSFTVVVDNMDVSNAAGKSQYSKTSLAMPVILDSGTTMTYLPEAIAADLAAGVGVTMDNRYGPVVPCEMANTNAVITFGFGNPGGPKIKCELSQFVVPFNPLYRPQFRNGKTACRWGIRSSGSDPNLFGDTFLRSAYVVYDLENDVVGIAQTTFNATKDAVEEITPDKVPGMSSTASGAQASQTFTGIPHGQPGAGGVGAAGSALTAPGQSATFDLGNPTGKAQKGAASQMVRPLGLGVTSVVVGFLVGMASLVGGGMLVLM